MKKLLETLTRAHGVSGDESAIRATIRQAAEPYADDITEDALGSLIVHQKGAGKKIMLAAHMDSVGAIVTHIEQSGFLRFGAIGGLEAKALYQTIVRFQNGTVGVIAVEESKEEKEFKLADLYIDIGARDRDEAKTMVAVGDTAAFAGALSGNGNRVMGPYPAPGQRPLLRLHHPGRGGDAWCEACRLGGGSGICPGGGRDLSGRPARRPP